MLHINKTWMFVNINVINQNNNMDKKTNRNPFMEEPVSDRPASSLTDFRRLRSVGRSGQNDPESEATTAQRFMKLTVSFSLKFPVNHSL